MDATRETSPQQRMDGLFKLARKHSPPSEATMVDSQGISSSTANIPNEPRTRLFTLTRKSMIFGGLAAFVGATGIAGVLNRVGIVNLPFADVATAAESASSQQQIPIDQLLTYKPEEFRADPSNPQLLRRRDLEPGTLPGQGNDKWQLILRSFDFKPHIAKAEQGEVQEPFNTATVFSAKGGGYFIADTKVTSYGRENPLGTLVCSNGGADSGKRELRLTFTGQGVYFSYSDPSSLTNVEAAKQFELEGMNPESMRLKGGFHIDTAGKTVRVIGSDGKLSKPINLPTPFFTGEPRVAYDFIAPPSLEIRPQKIVVITPLQAA